MFCLMDLFKFPEILVTRWLLWQSAFTKFDFGRRPDPAGGADDAPQTP